MRRLLFGSTFVAVVALLVVMGTNGTRFFGPGDGAEAAMSTLDPLGPGVVRQVAIDMETPGANPKNDPDPGTPPPGGSPEMTAIQTCNNTTALPTPDPA